MEAMAEARNDLVAGLRPPLDDVLRGGLEIAVRARLHIDRAVQLHALLPCTAVNVVEHVDRRGHRAVDRQAAGHGHARDRDRRRVRP